MTIYVVKPGDSLWSISGRYGVSIARIVEVNQLQEFPYLVPGQALVIPTTETAYVVLPGDTLWSISRRFNVSVGGIVALNNITNPNLIYPGMVIRIPEKSKNFGYIEVNGYIESTTVQEDTRIINEVGKYLTYVSPFSYQVDENGTLIAVNDTAIIQTGQQYGDAPLMVITNFRGGNFDSALGNVILTNNPVQQNLIANILDTMKQKGYYGLNIDFERLFPEDRQRYTDFVRKVVDTLRPLGYPVSVALAPKISGAQEGEWYSAHDYPALGQFADFVIIMTYEWGWSGGPPLPVAPINQVRAVIDYAVSVIPRKKIMMGMPLYGYDWTLPYLPHGTFAPRISPQEAIGIAAKFGSVIQYDQQSQSPFFYYTDNKRNRHIVWFEDARSIQAKLILESDYGLRGVSYWVLNSEFPQNWAVLDDMFQIVKM